MGSYQRRCPLCALAQKRSLLQCLDFLILCLKLCTVELSSLNCLLFLIQAGTLEVPLLQTLEVSYLQSSWPACTQ